jgi:flagellar basal-body rod modification protein FlgD
MEPMKSSDYVAQLATFSQVEKTIELNDRMASVLDAVRSQQAISMIGVAITSADSNKSGVIVASRVDGDGVVVTLESGEEVRIGRGVEVGRSNA